jgi:hypothetical protein
VRTSCFAAIALTMCAACGQKSHDAQVHTSAAPVNGASNSTAPNSLPTETAAAASDAELAAIPNRLFRDVDIDIHAYDAEAYKGPIKYPDFAGKQKPFSDYRTAIKEEVESGVNFGGRYVITIVGCGAGCSSGYVENVKTGDVYELPVGGEETLYANYFYLPSSTLFVARWPAVASTGGEVYCVTRYFNFDGRAFVSVGEAKEATFAPSVDVADCSFPKVTLRGPVGPHARHLGARELWGN